MHQGLVALLMIVALFLAGGGDILAQPPLPESLIIDSTYISDSGSGYPVTESSIELLGAWGKSELSVLLIPDSDERMNEWAIEAIKWWSTAIPVFTALHGYRYLDSLRIRVYVQGVNGSSGDIVVSYVDTLGGSKCGEAGISRYGGRIVEASIHLSLSCIDGRREVAMIVAAHELGHALGLGHSADCSDIMCPRVVLDSRPSTLDLYGLAVAYSWLESGRFRSPPAEASLPASIPMMKLLDAYGRPIKIKVKVYRSIDGGPVELLEELSINPGKSLRLTAEELISIAENERVRFDGWVIGSEEHEEPEITITPKYHLSVTKRYVTQYWIDISTGIDGGVKGWHDKGSRVELSVPRIVPLSSGSRLRFDGWAGTQEVGSNALSIVVEGPVKLEAMWVKQYLIDVKSSFGSVSGGGWYDEGSEAMITIEPPLVNLGNDTRIALRGFRGDVESNDTSISLLVDSPKTIEARWVTQYLVDVSSTHGGLGGSFWVDAGSRFRLRAEEVIEWPNATRALFVGWRGDLSARDRDVSLVVKHPTTLLAVYRVEYLVRVLSEYAISGEEGWYRPGELVVYRAPETIYLSNQTRAVFIGWSGYLTTPNLTVRLLVSSPLSLRANWRLEHLVRLDYPEPLRDELSWVEEGEVLQLSAPPILRIAPDELLEFKEWRGTYNLSSPILKLSVSRPITLEATYWRVFRAEIVEVPSLAGHERASFRLEGPGGVVLYIEGGGEAWLREGLWKVAEARWRGADVKDAEALLARGGVVEIPINIRSVYTQVVDALGLPVPGARVSISRDDGFVEASERTGLGGSAEIGPASGAARVIEVSYPFISKSLEITGEETEVLVVLPLGAYSMVLIIGASSALYYSARLSKRQRGRRSTPPRT